MKHEFTTKKFGQIKFLLLYLILIPGSFTAILVLEHLFREPLIDVLYFVGFLYLTAFPVVIAFVIYPAYLILRKPIPHKVEIDELNKEIILRYSWNRVRKIKYEDIAYALHIQKHYDVLVFYSETEIPQKPGYRFYTEEVDIIGLPWRGFTWTMNDLKDISRELDRIGVKKHEAVNTTSFYDRIIRKN